MTPKPPRCPACGSTYIYTLKSGAVVCRRCGATSPRRG